MIFSQRTNDEIIVNLNRLENRFEFVGDGVYDIRAESYKNHLREYTNEVIIDFEEEPNGEISEYYWSEVENILNLHIGKNGFSSYHIDKSHNKLVLEFDEDLPLVTE
jgi:hypothetical protein